MRGDAPAAVIAFAELESRRINVDALREYASEEGNPGNRKQVTSIAVMLPSTRLREGVVMVDTPGIGSLALAGSAETFAYLPRCDLGVVLIDAASTLDKEDLGVLRALYEAGIPAQVLLSKTDLLTPADRQRTAKYIHEQVGQELGLDLPVHLVSTAGRDEVLLIQWFEHEIAPLLDRHRALTEASMHRKIVHLRESVGAVLQTILANRRGEMPAARAEGDGKAARQYLDEADDAIRRARARCQDWTSDESALLEIILRDAAQAAVVAINEPGASTTGAGDAVLRVVQRMLTERSQRACELVTGLQQTLSGTLAAVLRTAPLADAEPAALRELVFGGLPPVDVSSLRSQCHWERPWWARLLSGLAVHSVRQTLRKQIEPSLREHVDFYDHQLRAWVKGCLSQLVGLYETQAEVFREQVRRLTAEVDSSGADGDVSCLEADLIELKRTESAEAETAAAHPHTISVTGE